MVSLQAGYLLLLLGTAHLFAAVYNRWLLCLTDGPIKRVVHQAWFFATLVLPTLLLAVFAPSAAVQEGLALAPRSPAAWGVSGAVVGLLALWAVQALRWLRGRMAPAASALVSESVEAVPGLRERPSSILGHFATTESLVVTRREIAVPGLAPAFDGFRIVQVSDVHYNRRRLQARLLDAVVRAVQQEHADAVVFTGDFMASRGDIRHAINWHAQLKGRHGTFAVMGNHDYWIEPDRVREALAKKGIRWLGGGERRELLRHGRRLAFVGSDAPWNHKRENWRRLAHRGHGDAVVLLSHTPDNGPAAARWGASLVLCGHTHGGEACLPGIGPLFVPSRYGLKYAAGVYDLPGGAAMNVSRGIGISSAGMRVCCPPEVCVITLRSPSCEAMAGAADIRAVAALGAMGAG